MAARSPELSVVLCARGRADELRRTLEALRAQTLAPDAFEIVVVRDGPGALDHASLAPDRRAAPGAEIRWSLQAEAGLATARNHGVFLARGAIVLFLDDVPDPDCLERHLEAHRRHPEPRCAVLGRAELDAAIADDPAMRFVHGRGDLRMFDPDLKPDEPLHWTRFRAGRSSCKRRFLVERGMFDAAFRTTGGDAELAYRLSRQGFQAIHEPAAVARVAQRLGVGEICARMIEAGRAGALFSRLHPAAEVDAWTDAPGASASWRELAPAYAAMVRSARGLDRIARERRAHGVPENAADRALLLRSYWAAFQASRVKGTAEGFADAASEG